MRVNRIGLIVAIIVFGLALAGCSSDSTSTPAPAPAPEPTRGTAQGFSIGDLALDFQLQSLDGESVSLSSLRGKPVMLNFWATWCGPCRVEMPFIQEVSEDREWAEQGLVILAVNLGESHSTANEFMEGNGLSFTVLLDADQSVAQEYNIRGIPTTFFIDKNGIIRDIKIGTFRNTAEIDWKLVNSILEDNS